MGEKYSYYHCQNRNCSARVTVPKEQLEADFRQYLQRLRPNEDYVKLFRESVVSVYRSKFEESLVLRGKLESDLQKRREDKWKLNETFAVHREVWTFAENLLLNAAGVWNQSSVEQRQRLQQVLFPKA
jgi:hypothetical protein